MHSLFRQIEFRLLAELLIGFFAPILAFVWWRLNGEAHANRFRAARQRWRTRLFGPPKPQAFYTDAKGLLRRVEPPFERFSGKAIVWILTTMVIVGALGFTAAALGAHAYLALVVGLLALAGGYGIVWVSWKAWAEQQGRPPPQATSVGSIAPPPPLAPRKKVLSRSAEPF